MQKYIALLLTVLSLQAYGAATDVRTSVQLTHAIAGTHRSAANRDRDQYRHPAETLTFFGITDTQTVVEIFPGAGWYTEILGPLLKQHGKLVEASYSDTAPDSTPYQIRATTSLRKMLTDNADLYGPVTVTALQPPDYTAIAKPGSADLVLTFRNVHNWVKDGTANAIFAAFYKALKPGGALGIEEHRAPPGTSIELSIKSGYMTEAEVIHLAEAAGFTLAGSSEINANPRDTKDYPEGVWALPPTFIGTAGNRERYKAIGESDRMTLKFIKPAR
jgi:predicted methyltransferase